MKVYFFTVWILISFSLIQSCNTVPSDSNANVVQDSQLPIDTIGKIKIKDTWIEPLDSFKFSGIKVNNKDTLYMEGCADFIFLPFGKIKSMAETKGTLLDSFYYLEKKFDYDIKSPIADSYMRVGHKRSELYMIFNKFGVADFQDYYVMKGKIIDSTISLINGIHPGMSQEQFYSRIFKDFPESKLDDDKKLIILGSCTGGTQIEFTLEKNILNKVEFHCPDCHANIMSYN